jgi:hypothetical protein
MMALSRWPGVKRACEDGKAAEVGRSGIGESAEAGFRSSGWQSGCDLARSGISKALLGKLSVFWIRRQATEKIVT